MDNDEIIDVEDFSDLEKEDLYSGMNTGRKRNYHNILERKRRNHIKDGYLKLRDAVPDVAHKKVARIHILKRAVEHISFLKEDIAKKEQHLRDLKILLKNAK